MNPARDDSPISRHSSTRSQQQLTPLDQSIHLTNKKLINIIKQLSSTQLIEQIQRSPTISVSPFKHSPIDVLRWTLNFLDHTNQEDYKVIQRTTDLINEGIPPKMQMVITMEVMNPGNFINLIMRKGFFHYLLMKYKPFVFVKPLTFLKHFGDDIKWYKEYLANVIYKVYSKWNVKEEYFDFLINRGCVEIMSAQIEWKPIHQLFLDSLHDYKPRIRKSIVTGPLFFQIQMHFACNGQGSIPFENTIHKLREFMETYNSRLAITMVRSGIIDTMDKEIENFQKELKNSGVITKEKGVDPDNRLACFQYCIFKLDKFITKSILYLQTMYSDDVRMNAFLTEDHIMGVIVAANRFLLFRNCDGTEGEIPQKQDVYPEDQRIKLFNFKSFASAIENPYQWRHFKSRENNWIPVFSVEPILPGQHLKILLKGNSKYICLGICSEKSYLCNRRVFQDDEQSVFLNVFKKKIFNSTLKTPITVDENIYSITMKYSQSRIDWIVNDKIYETSVFEKLGGMRLFAFASLCRDAEFQVIDF